MRRGGSFHRLGSAALRHAIEHAEELEAALLARTAELEGKGYEAQVLVKRGASLLFLMEPQPGDESVWNRVPLRRVGETWKAGGRGYSTAELLGILEAAPERISPNALLRPVFQDTILPTAAYVGGPAEVAYFAQSAVLYEGVLGRVTPVLPRFSSTLVEPAIAGVMAKHEVTLEDLFAARTADALAQRLGRAGDADRRQAKARGGGQRDGRGVGCVDRVPGCDGREPGAFSERLRKQDALSNEPAAAHSGDARGFRRRLA